ncbi:MAG: glycoside hydrolase family 9 protein [Treponema sp.]|jgi:endoglucanase|nr:glycoside hydrolase family 9 protein [Treponema sp.]
MNRIHINQLGYRPNDPKKAIITMNPPNDDAGIDFNIVRVSDKAVAYSGTASESVSDSASRDTVRIADFSGFTAAGEYVVSSGALCSYPFAIGDNPYADLRAAVLEMFHYQKCGVDLECGLWSHPACHITPAVIYGTDKKKDVSGGWHDAGDYGRYIVPAAKTIADLLWAYKLAANPDQRILDIVWFEIEWMLKMQDEGSSGGVYHKVSCEKFDALDEMPQDEKGELFLSPISATATADFAASIALASRFYPDHKDKLLNAAHRAWNWCLAHPDAVGFTNPPGISTGAYGDNDSRDERFWAACALFAATGDETYHDYIKTCGLYTEECRADILFPFGLGWGNVEAYGLIEYLLHTEGKTDDSVTRLMKDKLLRFCDIIMKLHKNNPYGVSLGDTYRWGSNMVAANNAMMLLLGSRFTDNSQAYIEAALEHFHYLLGRNPLSQSYITGFGFQASKNPHHRPSVAKGSAVPGMLVGGPCMNVDRDPAINAHCPDAPPAKRYVDHNNSFASNEVAIYWNSPMYFIMAFLGL